MIASVRRHARWACIAGALGAFLFVPPAHATVLPEYPGWDLVETGQAPDDEHPNDKIFYVLTPPDHRTPIVVNAKTATQLKEDDADPEKIYKTAYKSMAKKPKAARKPRTGFETYEEDTAQADNGDGDAGDAAADGSSPGSGSALAPQASLHALGGGSVGGPARGSGASSGGAAAPSGIGGARAPASNSTGASAPPPSAAAVAAVPVAGGGSGPLLNTTGASAPPSTIMHVIQGQVAPFQAVASANSAAASSGGGTTASAASGGTAADSVLGSAGSGKSGADSGAISLADTASTPVNSVATTAQYYNFVAGDAATCEQSVRTTLGSSAACTIGGGCSLAGQPPTAAHPSANPQFPGACLARTSTAAVATGNIYFQQAFNFVASDEATCEGSITKRLGENFPCSVGGGCAIDGTAPTAKTPSANPTMPGACLIVRSPANASDAKQHAFNFEAGSEKDCESSVLRSLGVQVTCTAGGSCTGTPGLFGACFHASIAQAGGGAAAASKVYYNFVASDAATCAQSVNTRLGVAVTCTVGGGCTLDGQPPSQGNPSANPAMPGACVLGPAP